MQKVLRTYSMFKVMRIDGRFADNKLKHTTPGNQK